MSTLHFDQYITEDALPVLAENVLSLFDDEVLSHTIDRKELTLVVKNADLAEVMIQLQRNKFAPFTQLMDICGVDWLGQDKPARFEVVYHLLCLTKNCRLRVKVQVNEGETVPSLTSVYAAANWYEREVFDMFGIPFEGHPDLRRILSDYDFEGHPLRKDFPLTGYVETYYDEKEQRVAYKPIDLPQDFRSFDKVSSWRGMTGNASLAEEDNVFEEGDFKQ